MFSLTVFNNACLLLLLFQYINVCVISHSLPKNQSITSSRYHCGAECLPGSVKRDLQCNYVKECCDDTLRQKLFNDITMQYCTFNVVQPIGAAILCISLLYAFWLISLLADDYFTPIMEQIAHVLGVSDELAGVTIVAFGNGAPDISTSVNALNQGANTTKLGLGTLLGSAIFVPMVGSAIISFVVKEPKVSPTPLIRDCFFLFIAAGCLLLITQDEKVTIHEALSMIMIYICYVGSVISGEVYRKWHTKTEERKKTTIHFELSITDKLMPIVGAIAFQSPFKHAQNEENRQDKQRMIQYQYDDEETQPIDCRRSLYILNHSADINQIRWKTVLYNILRAPIFIIEIFTKITIPLTNQDWNDYIAVISCTTAPIFIQFAFVPHSMKQMINDEIPIVAVVCVCGIIMSLFTFWRIKRKYRITQGLHSQLLNDTMGLDSEETDENVSIRLKKQPVMMTFFLVLGFLSSLAWFQLVAQEMVNLLTTLGVISTCDLTLLGLTLFSWGISLTDLVADISLSRKGYAKMGIAAAIGGNTFNLLIGVGLGTTIKTLRADNDEDYIPSTEPIFISCITLMVGLVIYVIWVGINNWTLKRSFGYFCFVYYAAFIVIIIFFFEL